MEITYIIIALLLVACAVLVTLLVGRNRDIALQQQRLNEFLNIALTNPIVTQLVGDEGLAYMLRQVVNKLGLNAEKIIPGPEMLRVKNFMAQQQMIQAQMAAQQQQPQNPENVTDQRRLMDGSPQANTKAA